MHTMIIYTLFLKEVRQGKKKVIWLERDAFECFMSLKKWLRGWSYKYVLPQLIPIEESKGRA